MRASTVLRRVLALFEDGRWAQKDWHEKQGRINRRGNRRPPPVNCFCLAGAIGYVEGGRPDNTRRHGKLSKTLSDGFYSSKATAFLKKAIGVDNDEEVWDYNDKQGRTLGEIITTTRRALRLAERAKA